MKIVVRFDVEIAGSNREIDSQVDRIVELVERVGEYRYCVYETDDGFEDPDLEKELRKGMF